MTSIAAATLLGVDKAIAVFFFGLLGAWAFWEAYRWSPERFRRVQQAETAWLAVGGRPRHAAFSRRMWIGYGCLFSLICVLVFVL